MVEMLCVLGIIGVLSVAGMSGYGYLTNKHHVNDLHAKALERAMAISAQLLMGKRPSLSSFRTSNKTSVGTFDSSVIYLDQEHFAVKINRINQKICEILIKTLSKHAMVQTIVTPNENTYDTVDVEDCKEENNELALVFDVHLLEEKTLPNQSKFEKSFNDNQYNNNSSDSSETSNEPEECSEPGWLDSHGHCCPDSPSCTEDCAIDDHCPETFICLHNACVCPNNLLEDTETDSCVECLTNDNCSTNHVCSNNACACPSGTVEDPETNSCVSCLVNSDCPNTYVCQNKTCVCPANHFEAKDRTNTTNYICASCDDLYRYETTLEQCNICGKDRILMTENSKTYCDWNCPAGWFRNKNRNCTNCGLDAAKETSQEECDKCIGTGFHREMQSGKCALIGGCPEGTFKSSKDDTCYPCSDPISHEAIKAECDKCSSDRERITIDTKNFCILRCETGYFRSTEDNECHLCSDETPYKSLQAECSQCSDRILYNGFCILKGHCLDNTTFWNTTDGTCSSCVDELFAKESSEDACAVCGTSRFYGTKNGIGDSKMCNPVCPDGWFQNKNGNCTHCGNTASKATTETECNKCAPKTDFKRKMSSGKCTLPGGCPSGYFKGSTDSICRHCSEKTTYKSTEAECNKCVDADGEKTRQWSNNNCSLKEGN